MSHKYSPTEQSLSLGIEPAQDEIVINMPTLGVIIDTAGIFIDRV